jgi:hypothetical protein
MYDGYRAASDVGWRMKTGECRKRTVFDGFASSYRFGKVGRTSFETEENKQSGAQLFVPYINAYDMRLLCGKLVG